ncbi:MAG: hypothetical protein RIN56_12330 [Sporomusaceae bacterium]|nr:hypothetical protein [Sporomusaceae bacterium]
MTEQLTVILTWLEQHLAWALLIVFVAVNVLVLAAMALYVKARGLPSGRFKTALHKILFEIDRSCDYMGIPSRRAQAISQFQQLMFWPTLNKWRIYPPAAVIGWIIDAEVAIIRRMQAATGIENLHQEDAPAPPAVPSDNPGEGA